MNERTGMADGEEKPLPTVDPARFGDPLAQKTQWTQFSASTANFRTMHLVNVPGGMEYRLTPLAVAFAVIMVVIGPTIMWKGGPYGFNGTFDPVKWDGQLVNLLIGAALTLGGTYLPYFHHRERPRFDIGNYIFISGKDSFSLQDIHAIQLIRTTETSEGDDGQIETEHNNQINLVRKDASRVHLINLQSAEAVRGDAATISLLLGCKVWDALG